VRPFKTLRANLSQSKDPQAELLKLIAAATLDEAVVRLIYQARAEQLDQIDSSALHQALSAAHTYTIQAELMSQLARPRLPEMGTGQSADPMTALQTYLTNQPHLSDLSAEMITAALALLANEPPEREVLTSLSEMIQPSNKTLPATAQLRLL
jgi:DNA repair protein SbcD/Mre11